MKRKSSLRKVTSILTLLVAVLILANFVYLGLLAIDKCSAIVGLILGPTTMFISGTNFILLSIERRDRQREFKQSSTSGKTNNT